MGCKFKTFRGASERAQFERWHAKGSHRFEVIDADAHDKARGFAFRIHKTKNTTDERLKWQLKQQAVRS